MPAPDIAGHLCPAVCLHCHTNPHTLSGSVHLWMTRTTLYLGEGGLSKIFIVLIQKCLLNWYKLFCREYLVLYGPYCTVSSQW